MCQPSFEPDNSIKTDAATCTPTSLQNINGVVVNHDNFSFTLLG